jgi:ATP-binding cassette, subfamily B, bacterial PglK
MSHQAPLMILLPRLWRHIARRRRLQLVAIGGLTLVSTVAELASIAAVLPFLGALTAPQRIFAHPWARPLIARFELTDPDELVLPLTVVFALAAVFAAAARLALLWGQTMLGSAIGVDLSSAAYRRTLYQPYPVHAMRNTSEVVAGQVTKVNSVITGIIVPFLTLVTSAFIVIVIVSLMISVEPFLTLATFAGLGGLYAIVARASQKRLARASRRVALGQSHVTQVVQEGLGGIRDVLIDGLQETYSRIYRRADHQLRQALAHITILGGAPRPVIEAFGVILIAAFAYHMSRRPDGVATAIPMLGMLALAAQRLLPLVQQGYSSWTAMVGTEASLSDVLGLLEQRLPAYSTLSSPTPIPFRRHIRLDDLHFRYGPTGPWVLRGINLEIRRGSRLGLIGATGSGKSTLLDIVMGLLTPTLGAMYIDDTVVDEGNHRAWQVHIAHVPQAIYLADTSVAENIAFGVAPEAIDPDRVREAARRAQIASTIESWPQGYDTFVGERGIRLSGGQRQRIGIARALYKRADVLVFDEATNALDTDTEKAVMEGIDSLSNDLTIIMVAHRMTTLKNCEQIIELDGGVVARIATYQDIAGRADDQQEGIAL